MISVDRLPRLPGSALCAQTDGEIFFPQKGGSHAVAKQICMACDVRVACLEWAMANNEQEGIWGGLSPRQRAKLRRERRAA